MTQEDKYYIPIATVKTSAWLGSHDKGVVSLVDMMPRLTDVEQAPAAAARASFNRETKGKEKDLQLLKYLIEHQHTSPLEQVIFQWKITAMGSVWNHFIRHRTARVNLQSARYTRMSNDFYTPSHWRLQHTDNKQGSEGQLAAHDNKAATDIYIESVMRSYRDYDRLLELGVAREQARFVLPYNAIYITGIYQMDLNNFVKFLKLRLSQDAQEETRAYAMAMYVTVAGLAPTLFSYFDFLDINSK